MGFELTLHADGRMGMLVPDGAGFVQYEGSWAVQNKRIELTYTARGMPRWLVYEVRENLKPADTRWRPSCQGSLGLAPVSSVPQGSPSDYLVWPRQAVLAGLAPCPE